MKSLTVVFNELLTATDHYGEDANKALVDAIQWFKTIYVYGAGRSGLALQMFAMRLAQMGKPVVVVGQVTAPPIKKDDLLIVASGSGETAQSVQFAQKALDAGAGVLLISTSDDNTIAKLASQTVVIGGKAKYATDAVSQQPLGALFEQLLFLFLEATVMDLMAAWHLSEEQLASGHANLE